MRKLQEVIRHIEQTATWYEDEEAFVGEWVFFEAAFAYRRLDELFDASGYRFPGSLSHPHVVVFMSEQREPVDLMLHGSAQHLLADRYEPNMGEVGKYPELWMSGTSGRWYERFANELRQAIAGTDADSAERLFELEGLTQSQFPRLVQEMPSDTHWYD